MYYKFNVIGNKGTTKRAILSSYKLLRIARTLRHDIILLDAITAYRGKYCDVHRQLFSQDLCEIHKNYFPRYTPFGSSFSVPKGRYSLTRASLHSNHPVSWSIPDRSWSISSSPIYRTGERLNGNR